MSPTATTSTSLPTSPCSTIARNTSRPMRPNPLIATLTAIISISVFQFPIQNAHNIGGIFSVNEETGAKRQPRKNPKQIANHKSQSATLNYYIEKLVFGISLGGDCH